MATYNHIGKRARNWGDDKKVRVKSTEYCVRVKGGKVQSSNPGLAKVAGNGQYGFPTRKHDQDELGITVGMDGQFMRKRKSLARRKKNISRLATSRQINVGCTDRLILKERFCMHAASDREKVVAERRAKRKRNRNRKAARNRRKS